MGRMGIDSTEIIDFWFTEIQPAQRFKKDRDLDRLIARRFGEIHRLACTGELYTWRDSAPGSLAEIIVLDQFSRNIYRDQPEAFAADSLALTLARNMVSSKQDRKLSAEQKSFAYMPYMHSESKEIHQQAVSLFQQPGLEHSYKFELKHKEIIDRFGRYPHRNAILGRESSPEELEFLRQPGSRF